MSRAKRSTGNYLASAAKLAIIIPRLKKYKRRKTLSRWEKSAIARAEKLLVGTYNLHPVTAKQARSPVIRDALFKPYIKGKPAFTTRGVRALQLNNTGEDVSINVVNRNMFITSNGRTWVYWSFDNLAPEDMEEAGTQAFNPSIRDAFPVEKIIRLAEKAFNRPQVKMIGLWASSGRVGEGFLTLPEFVMWVYDDYSRYRNVERWVNGIAILIADVGEKVPLGVWSNKQLKEIERQRVYRRRQNKKR